MQRNRKNINIIDLTPVGCICLMLIGLIFYLVGCSNGDEKEPASPSDIHGQIILDIVEWLPEEVHHKFLVVPQEGSITYFTGSAKMERSEAPLGTRVILSCLDNPTSVSPDHKYVAECKGVYAHIANERDQFILRRSVESTILYRREFGSSILISGFLWSQDSRAIAVLTHTVHLHLFWNPLYWVYALSGHPVQSETYDLHVIDVANLNATEFKVPFEARSSMGKLVGWEDSRQMGK